jgi:rhomboid protease GluP
MMWIRQLAPVTAHVYGASRLVIIYTVSSITGFTLSTLGGITLTLGASAPLFGLFGALVWAGKRTGSVEMGRQALIYAVIFLVFGFIMPGIDNFAHIGGFIGGFLTALVLDPLKKENFSNMVTALICLILTGLSVLVSVVSAYW